MANGNANQNSEKERKDPQVLDQSEFESMIRGEGEDRKDVQVVDKGRGARQEGEPEVIREEEKPVTKPVAKKEDEVDPESPLGRALSTIETMRGEITELRTQRTERTAETSRREAEVETEDFVPGVRVPKDRSRWPIKLSKELVEKAGLNGDLTQPLEVLGNLLYWDVARLVNEMVGNTVETRLRGRQDDTNRRSQFLKEFPDLGDHEDMTEFTEGRLRAQNRHMNITDDNYRILVATETRRTLAKARGVTYEQYMNGIEGKGGNQPVTTRQSGNQPRQSRVISTGTGRRGPGEGAPTAFEREAGDLMQR